MYNPGVPCRHTCSTNHSPSKHEERSNKDKMTRFN